MHGGGVDKEGSEGMEEPVVMVSLVPSIVESLKATYHECTLIVTRREGKKRISCCVDGKEMGRRCKDMDDIIEKIAQHLGGTGESDPKQWWSVRRQRNDEIVELIEKTMPDAMYLAMPLLTFPKSVNWETMTHHLANYGFEKPSGMWSLLQRRYMYCSSRSIS